MGMSCASPNGKRAMALLHWLAFAVASAGGATGESCICTKDDFGGMLPPQPADPCHLGPSYWCQPGSNNLVKCNLDWVERIGVAGYLTGHVPTAADLAEFCTQNPWALAYNGGLVGLPPGNTGYFSLALYWPPTSCGPNQTAGGGFCSEYTKAGLPGGSTLQLHGLWPDFGSLYDVPGAPSKPGPSLAHAYQGWSQYCKPGGYPGAVDYSQCHINGGMCPLSPNRIVHQGDYEKCMRRFNITPCITNEDVVEALREEFAVHAAGYLGKERTFIDHEFAKHGSCVGGYLTRNKTAFFEEGLRLVKILKGPGEIGQVVQYVHTNSGGVVPTSALVELMEGKAVPRCNAHCHLSEIWFCFGRDAAGYPTSQIECPPGTRASDNCSKGILHSHNCDVVVIPNHDSAGIDLLSHTTKSEAVAWSE